jgi:hypothetical protein
LGYEAYGFAEWNRFVDAFSWVYPDLPKGFRRVFRVFGLSALNGFRGIRLARGQGDHGINATGTPVAFMP